MWSRLLSCDVLSIALHSLNDVLPFDSVSFHRDRSSFGWMPDMLPLWFDRGILWSDFSGINKYVRFCLNWFRVFTCRSSRCCCCIQSQSSYHRSISIRMVIMCRENRSARLPIVGVSLVAHMNCWSTWFSAVIWSSPLAWECHPSNACAGWCFWCLQNITNN